MKFGVGTPTVCASPPGGRFSPPEPVPTLGPVRGMGPTSEAKWEGWSEAEGLRRESSRPPGGRVDIRSAEEQPYPGGRVPDSALLPSTKSAFLCAFALRNPHFRAFRAQNRGFCALLGSETLVFGHFEHKIGFFVRFMGPEPPFSGFPSTKTRILCAFASGQS